MYPSGWLRLKKLEAENARLKKAQEAKKLFSKAKKTTGDERAGI
jgi:hypothetical protein